MEQLLRVYKLEQAILMRLRRGAKERFTLAAKELPALRFVLRAVVKSAGAEGELKRVLALSVAMETKLESPAVAATILELLRGEPEAIELVRPREHKPAGIDELRRFRQAEGRHSGPRAPRFGEAPQATAIPLFRLAAQGFVRPGRR